MFVQKRTNFSNENGSLITVSEKVQCDDQDSKQLQSENSRQRYVSRMEEARPTKQPTIKARTSMNVERDRKKINKTTLMLFLITVIYVTTWMITWSSKIYKTATNVRSLKIDFLMERLYLINCMTNPIFYIFMSSKARQKAKELFCK
jgi:anaerobic C4-dicarboxylate transporter